MTQKVSAALQEGYRCRHTCPSSVFHSWAKGSGCFRNVLPLWQERETLSPGADNSAVLWYWTLYTIFPIIHLLPREMWQFAYIL